MSRTTLPYNANRGLEKRDVSDDETGPVLSGKSIQVFPNPTADKFKVTVPKWYSDLRVLLSNPSGQVLLERRLQDESAHAFELDLKGMPNGVYFLRILTTKGGNSYVKKVVKH